MEVYNGCRASKQLKKARAYKIGKLLIGFLSQWYGNAVHFGGALAHYCNWRSACLVVLLKTVIGVFPEELCFLASCDRLFACDGVLLLQEVGYYRYLHLSRQPINTRYVHGALYANFDSRLPVVCAYLQTTIALN